MEDRRWWQEFDGIGWWDFDALLFVAVGVLVHRSVRAYRRHRRGAR